MENAIKFINQYLFSGWDQIPFLFGIVLVNVISGIIAADSFSWTVFGQKMKQKAIFYLLCLLAIHFICFLPWEGTPLYQTVIQVPFTEIDISIFRTLNSIAILNMAAYEFLSMDDNIFKKYDRRFIPSSIGNALRSWTNSIALK